MPLGTDIRSEMMTDLNNGGLKTDDSSAPSQNTDLAPSTTETVQTQSAQAPNQTPNLTREEQIELDKLEKFKFGGEEWTPATLKAAMLRQQDYSKKTQETAAERKFLDNFEKDIETVKGNPSLAAEFKRIYPPKYHQFVDRLLSTSETQALPETNQNQNNLFNDPKVKELLSDVTELKSFHKQQAEKSAMAEIDATLRELVSKHSVPVEAQKDVELVTLKKIEMRIAQNKEDPANAVPITAEVWAKAYEQTFNDFNKTMEALYKQKVTKQTEASRKAKDTGAGGGTPGSAPEKVSMKDVKAQMLRDVKMGKASLAN